ncbi:MAG: hypothetical protein KF708_18885 [Pirellulales bacterium]|nr:hypothetical protein [Pirellulales bacterium]
MVTMQVADQLALAASPTRCAPPRFGWGAWLAPCLLLCLAGCAASGNVALRSVPKNPLTERLLISAKGYAEPSDRTAQLLRKYDLAGTLKESPRETLVGLRTVTQEEPSAEKLYAFAELSYLAGKRVQAVNQQEALDLYSAAVAHAYLYLFDDRVGYGRNPYDPQFRGACDLYNGALEDALRIVSKKQGITPGATHSLTIAGSTWDLSVVSRSKAWHDTDFERFEFVSDYEIRGLTNRYQTHGLGVPLIAVRKPHKGAHAAEDYYPPGLSFPVTAFLRVMPPVADASAAGGVRRQALLELYDPLTSTDINVAGARVPLESDLSTPLAYFLDRPEFVDTSTIGLLSPAESQETRGLKMVQPYQPGKIPVILVHGLWSSPITWMEMFNDLRSDPLIRAHYQFWFYQYPSGQPFWISATQFRADLWGAREKLDPAHREPALDQMILVGHSMGGLVSKMQTVESADAFWRIVSDRPFTDLKADPATRTELERLFFFHPNPSVRRVVTIGTPHRGSQFANATTRYLGHKLISLPQMMVAQTQTLYRENSDLFRDASLLTMTTSIDSLAPDSPVLPVLLTSPQAPWVRYHNIVGVVEDTGWKGRFAGRGDGIVDFSSAHLDNVESEIAVNADHLTVHRHPRSVLEVRRILLEQHAELHPARPPGPRLYQATAPPNVGPHLPPGAPTTPPWPADRAATSDPAAGWPTAPVPRGPG